MDLALFVPDVGETVDALMTRSMAEWLEIAGGLVWIAVVALPLTGIDRRDSTTAMTYVTFCIAAAVLLLFAMPMRHASFADAGLHLSIIAGAAFFSTLRWFSYRTQLKDERKGNVE